jgi:(2R)-sulfolactate sulfo-lyase subunit alpha
MKLKGITTVEKYCQEEHKGLSNHPFYLGKRIDYLIFKNMKHGILLHEPQDDVGVAVMDLKKGSTIGAMTLEGKAAGRVKLLHDVPLGHKVALRDLRKEKPVLKYGRPVGKAVQDIQRGAHVHTHNMKTLRWSI